MTTNNEYGEYFRNKYEKELEFIFAQLRDLFQREEVADKWRCTMRFEPTYQTKGS